MSNLIHQWTCLNFFEGAWGRTSLKRSRMGLKKSGFRKVWLKVDQCSY